MTEGSTGKRTLVGGVGYFNLSDLSVGPALIDELKREVWPSHIELDDLSEGPISLVHRFAETVPAYDRLVLVAAVDRGGADARISTYRWDRVLPPPDEIQARVGEAVTGVIDLDNLLVVTRQFGALPEDVSVVEIQPIEMGFGLAPGPQVAALLPEARRLVRALAEGGDRFSCQVAGLGGRRPASAVAR